MKTAPLSTPSLPPQVLAAQSLPSLTHHLEFLSLKDLISKFTLDCCHLGLRMKVPVA